MHDQFWLNSHKCPYSLNNWWPRQQQKMVSSARAKNSYFPLFTATSWLLMHAKITFEAVRSFNDLMGGQPRACFIINWAMHNSWSISEETRVVGESDLVSSVFVSSTVMCALCAQCGFKATTRFTEFIYIIRSHAWFHLARRWSIVPTRLTPRYAVMTYLTNQGCASGAAF